MYATQLQQLAAAIEEQPELGSLINLSEQQVLNRLLRLVALPRTFDERMFRDLLTVDFTHGPVPSFERFVAKTEVERVAYTADRFMLPDSARAAYLTEWVQAEPAAVRDWTTRLLAYYGDTGNPYDVLDLLIRADQPRAREEFARLYNEADGELDLARCYTLLEVLRARSAEIDVETHALLTDCSALYGARTLYAEAFHQTVCYFQRPTAQQALEDMLPPESPHWIFHLHAPGGMGKTMMLRWMVSHRLSPRPLRVPCVWLDFDSLSMSAVANVPSLLALPIAEQLDSQLQLSGLQRIIATMQSYRRLLRQSEESISSVSDQALRDVALTERLTLLQDALMQLPVTRPLVFILDTIEEASNHQPDGLMRIIEFFKQLHDSLPQVRLVLSGRSALGIEQVPEYTARFREATVYQELTRLNAAETREFFTVLRPEASDALKDAVVVRGEGNPFKIGMLAEIVGSDAAITPERLLSDEFKDADVAYLLQRVIKRIPVANELPVRWILRYGAVPRHLTKDFVAQVLLDPLQRALAGTAQAAGDDMVAEAISSGLWIPRKNVTIDIDDLWKQLTKYSSMHGWISVDRTTDVATLHNDILNPTRRLLRPQHVFRQIQARAVDYFERQGSPVDVLFHKAQLDTPDQIVESWAAAFTRADLRNDPAARRRLADALVSSDFDDAPDDAKLVGHREALEAIAAIHGYVFLVPGVEFDTLRLHANAAETLRTTSRGRTVPYPDSIAICLAATDEFKQTRQQEARQALETYWTGATEPGDCARAALHAAEMAVRTQDASAELWLQRVLDADADGAPGAAPQRLVHERLANVYFSARQWDKAREAMQRAADQARKDNVQADTIRLGRRLIEWDIQTNAWQQAETELDALDPTRSSGDYLDLRAQLATATLRPALAMRYANLALSGTQRLENARLLLTLGDALQQALRISEAIASYQRASRICERNGDLEGVDAACTRELMLHLRTTGNLVAAARILTSERLYTADVIRGTQWDVGRAWIALENGGREAAQQVFEPGPEATRDSAYRMVCRLSLGVDASYPRGLMRQLLASLDGVQPPAARLSVFGDLAVTTAWPRLGWLQTRRLLARFPFKPKDPIEGAPQALLYAELLRDVRRYGEALAVLDQHLPASIDLASTSDAELQPTFWSRLCLERAIRAEAGVDAPRAADRLRSGVPGTSTLLEAAIAIELAALALAIDDRATATRLYQASAAGCDAESVPTLVHALRADVGSQLDLLPRSAAAEAYRAVGHLRRVARLSEPPPRAEVTRASREIAGVTQAVDVAATPPPERHAIDADEQAIDANDIVLDPQNNIFSVSIRDTRSFTVMRFDHGIRPTELPVQAHGWLSLFTASSSRRGPAESADRFAANWQPPAQALAETLREGIFGSRLTNYPERVYLDLQPELAAIPWELALLEEQRAPDAARVIRWIGPASQGAPASMSPRPDVLKQLGHVEPPDDQRRPPARPRVILLIDPESTYRTESGFAYTKLEPTLRQFDLDVVTADSLASVTRGRHADLIIVVSPLLDAASLRSLTLLLDRATAREFGFNASMFKDEGADLNVILDVPRSGTSIESVQQLFARNRFAHDLMCTGTVSSVLATGLGEAGTALDWFSMLGHEIATGSTLDETLLRLRGRRDRGSPLSADLSAELLPAGTALFTNKPAALLAPRGGASPAS